jgi:hypothetical protein
LRSITVARSYEDLKDAVKANDGVCEVTMGDLKAIEGAGRLGVRVLTSISRELSAHGLGHLPPDLPGDQQQPVRLYLLGSPVDDIVRAVLHPCDQGDRILRDIATSEAQDKLRMIRELVCDS